ncbi:hypothetical protein [uncultured Planktomarina sp.]|uniref:hypothetical protein n=1 Tax=uncultured Planktomarina sp. TaxID=1538529 RepID=UPI0032613C0E
MRWLVKFFAGGGLGAITDRLADAYEAKTKAETDKDRIKADVTISQLEARQSALIEGQGSWVSKAVQAAWAAPFVIYTSKVVVWDKVLKLGVTDPLGQYEQNLGLLIAGFYFLSVTGQSIASKVRGR